MLLSTFQRKKIERNNIDILICCVVFPLCELFIWPSITELCKCAILFSHIFNLILVTGLKLGYISEARKFSVLPENLFH